ncbi:MAG: hypothetical protein ACE366_16565 [Bradymonadia bacterium]
MDAEAEQQPYGWEKSWVDTQQGDGAWTQGECYLYMRWASSNAYWTARWFGGESTRRFRGGRFEDVAPAAFRAARELLVETGRLPEISPGEEASHGHAGTQGARSIDTGAVE